MGNAVAYSKPSTLETCSGSVRCLMNKNAKCLQHKGACYDSQKGALDAPLLPVHVLLKISWLTIL